MGGGVAAFDCNGDGRQDLYLAGGADSAALYRNDSPVGGALHFTQLHDPATDLDEVTGAYPLDIDGDGVTDLAVLRVGGNVLLRGLGDCRFERANEAWGFNGGSAWSAAFSATWESGASLPTLAVGNYLTLNPDGTSGLPCSGSELFRPDASGSRYAASLPLTPSYCPLSMLFSDWDRSGRRDLRVSNDRHYYGEASDGEEQLWRIAAGEPPRLYTQADGWQKVRVWGMGIASYDLTGDGYPEVYLTSQGDNKLQALADGPAQPNYTDIALDRGVTATRPYAGDTSLPSTAWHDEFADVNNDGRADLLVTKGNVDAMPDFATRDPSDLLVQRADGTFSEEAEAAGIASYATARGAAVADFNLDGMLDIVVVNRNENVSLWRSVGWGDAAAARPMGNWIALRLAEPAPNTRCHRRLGRRRGGQHERQSRGDRGRRPCERRAGMDPLRDRLRGGGDRDDHLAGRHPGGAADGARQHVRDRRARRERCAAMDAPRPMSQGSVDGQVLRLGSDEVEVEILPGLGGRLHRLRAFGRDLLRTPEDLAAYRREPFFWGGFVMAPWCNRIEARPTSVGDRSWPSSRTSATAPRSTARSSRWPGRSTATVSCASPPGAMAGRGATWSSSDSPWPARRCACRWR